MKKKNTDKQHPKDCSYSILFIHKNCLFIDVRLLLQTLTFDQQIDYRQMLRTYAFTLTALNALAGLALILSNNGIFSLGTEFRASLLAVLNGEDIRNWNAHRTALGTVTAAGTWD